MDNPDCSGSGEVDFPVVRPGWIRGFGQVARIVSGLWREFFRLFVPVGSVASDGFSGLSRVRGEDFFRLSDLVGFAGSDG